MGKKKKAAAGGSPTKATTGTTADVPFEPSGIHVGRFRVKRNRFWADGSDGGEATSCGDALTEVYVPVDHLGRVPLAEALEDLAKTIRNTEDDYGGAAEIVVLRRFSHSALKRLRG